jgi:hypothetical protein
VLNHGRREAAGKGRNTLDWPPVSLLIRVNKIPSRDLALANKLEDLSLRKRPPEFPRATHVPRRHFETQP